jgi:signal transduction histidine kinase
MYFKALLFFCVIFFTPNFLQAQVPDSINIRWYKQFFDKKGNATVDDELKEIELRQEEAAEVRDPVMHLIYLKAEALVHIARTNNFDKAMDVLIHALTIEDSLDLSKSKILTYLALGEIYERVGSYSKSAEQLQQAFKLNDVNRDQEELIYILQKQGRVNAALDKLADAYENYQFILDINDSVGKPRIEAEALFNIANLFKLQSKYTESLTYHKRALSLWRSVGDRTREAKSLNDIGDLYLQMKNEERALANHVAALEIRQTLKDQTGIAESHNAVAWIYLQQKNIERAIANLQLALEAAKESHAHEQLRRSYEYLTLCYKEKREYERALETQAEYIGISELIEREKNDQQLFEKQNQYTLFQRETQIDKLEAIREQREAQLAAEQKVKNYLYMGLALIGVILLLIFYLYLSKRRSNKILQAANEKINQQNVQLQQLNATKDKFFSIIGHDVKGPLNSLTSFASLLINHFEQLSKEEIQTLAKDLDKSLKNLFALLENLLEWARSQTGTIDFKTEPFDLSGLLRENQELLKAQATNKNIVLINKIESVCPVQAHRHSINTVIRNLVSNAIKFTPEGGTITLDIKREPSQVVVSVADTGVGMSKEVLEKLFRIDSKHSTLGTAKEKGTGLGLILCKDFVEKNGGSLSVQSEAGKGSVFSFTLPSK